MRDVPDVACITHRERRNSRMSLRPIDECYSFFRLQLHWLEPETPQCVGGVSARARCFRSSVRVPAPMVKRSFPDHCNAKRCKWCKIAAGANAPLLRDRRIDAGVEHPEEEIDEIGTCT